MEQAAGEEQVVIPMPGQELVTMTLAFGSGIRGFHDGCEVEAAFTEVYAILRRPDGTVLLADYLNHSIRMMSPDLGEVTTVAGDGEAGHTDGVAAQARFSCPRDLALLPDGRVLVTDQEGGCRLRLLSADLREVSTVAGGLWGHQDGAAAQAQFDTPKGIELLPDGRILVADSGNRCIRMLSTDLLQVSTVAGDGVEGFRDGAAAQARFANPSSLKLLPDGRVLIADEEADEEADGLGNRIRVLSADLQEVSTVAGDGKKGHRDGPAAHARFSNPGGLAMLPDGRVLVTDDYDSRIRVLSADLQDVTTLTIDDFHQASCFEVLPDGRVLVASDDTCICVLEGLVPLEMGPKPAAKPPKKVVKRALAARSLGPALKRGRSGAGLSSTAAPASSDSDNSDAGGSVEAAVPLC